MLEIAAEPIYKYLQSISPKIDLTNFMLRDI